MAGHTPAQRSLDAILDRVDTIESAVISGGAISVTVTDASSDTTMWPLLTGTQTGNIAVRSDGGLTYNASTDALTATTFVGALTGTASGNLVSGGALGTPSSATLTNATGYLSTNITNAAIHVIGGSDTTITSADAALFTKTITGLVAGNLITVEGWLTYLNDSGATRAPIITIDWDGLFDVELQAGAMVNSATLRHPCYFHGVLDIRATNLCYGVCTVEWELAAGRASGDDSTVAQTHLRAMGWGTSTTDATGSTDVTVSMRTGANTVTQTCRLHGCIIKVLKAT